MTKKEKEKKSSSNTFSQCNRRINKVISTKPTEEYIYKLAPLKFGYFPDLKLHLFFLDWGIGSQGHAFGGDRMCENEESRKFEHC